MPVGDWPTVASKMLWHSLTKELCARVIALASFLLASATLVCQRFDMITFKLTSKHRFHRSPAQYISKNTHLDLTLNLQLHISHILETRPYSGRAAF